MPTPPILEIYVLWHPDDEDGRVAAEYMTEHFHGPAYAGLAGGAVEVYRRSMGWVSEDGPPRPLPFMKDLPAGLAPAQLTVVVPILSRELARAVRDSEDWREYMEKVFTADPVSASASQSPWVAVYPVASRSDLSGTHLSDMASTPQSIRPRTLDDPTLLARELAQAITQRLHRESGGAGDDRVKVFVSHTKRYAPDEGDGGRQLVEGVREVLQDTRLDAFFDAHDIQTGEDWVARLASEAGRNALLTIRTNLYASREWTQREVLVAKQHDVPLVALHAVRTQEDRGSFLMDHMPVVVCPPGDPKPAIEAALNRLVDEALKKALWRAQRVYLETEGFDWLPAHAPEPTTLTHWLSGRTLASSDPNVVIIHPDPPLGPPEQEVVQQICRLVGVTGDVDVLTPRTFAARGGGAGDD
ncbi:hypothetical protein [Nocardioides caricicola]|uniref:TIR domain-containing protein n=1 Tax=Nocardioides caricicola TaxID=634770 RepID=A0ABW0N194_9ACTN